MPESLNVLAWRGVTPNELIAFTEGTARGDDLRGSHLIVRSKLTQIDMYSYLRARFGAPNGFQNFLRKDDSDNLIHWDFNLRAGDVDVYILGRMRDVAIMVTEPMTDEDWKALIVALKADFGRIGSDKSRMLKSFEKFVVFQNKFEVLANLCGDLHASIVDAPEMLPKLPRMDRKEDVAKLKLAMDDVAKRATALYGDCLKLRLLTPIMAEAFLNLMILTLVRDDVRNDRRRYDEFVREKIPEKLAQLSSKCVGFDRSVDPSSDAYKEFLRVMNARNFALHGNIEPIREQIETVYFEGKRPLFSDGGDHIFKLFEHLEQLNKPQEVIKDYEAVHLFLAELLAMLESRHRVFLRHILDDPYPGYEVLKKRVTKVLPPYQAAMLLPGERYDDDLNVTW